ncbi:MAG: FAD-binding oxidoreductase [Sphingomonadales bacterium]|nr:FAD-binding oxidoreductase [Sphingomonadales bacterium]
MTARFDICVLGAGLAGSALASSLAARGLRVAIFESNVCAGRGASAYSGGIIRAFDEDPAQSTLAIRGVHDWLTSRRSADLIRQCGVINIIEDARADRAAALVAELSSSSYPIKLLSGREAAALAPGLDLATDRAVAVFEPMGGVVDVKLAARLMLCAARDQDAVVLEHASIGNVRKIDRGIRLEGRGFAVECAVLAVAAGPWSPRWLADTEVVVRRIQLSVALASGIDRCLVDQMRAGYLVPGHAGTVAVGSFDPPIVEDPDQALEPCTGRHDRHFKLLRQLTGNPVSPLGEIIGLDAYTPSLLPRIGFTGPERTIFAFTGFSGRGAKYLPHVAELAAAELAESAACHADR